MKITKTASGKRTIKISRKEWETIGKTAGWDDDYDSGVSDDPYANLDVNDLVDLVDDTSSEIDNVLLDLDLDPPAKKDKADDEADKEESRVKHDRHKAKEKREKEHARRKKQVYDKPPVA